MTYPQTSFAHTTIAPSSLLGQRRAAAAARTLTYQLQILRDTGRYDAFKLEWHPVYDDEPEIWPIPNHLFWESDVAKWIEGACYFLRQEEMPDLDAAVQELVEMIRQAQRPDGYLNVHYTVVEPGKRFTNLRDMHELYNAGHLIEAALAHNDLYGNDLLLQPIIDYVNLLYKIFGKNSSQIPGYPGHPEIELALLRLYDRTRDSKHLELATFFITERGNATGYNGKHYYDHEAYLRKDDPHQLPAFYPEPRAMWYHQAHAPIVEQSTIEGHSVRAMYLLTAVADLVRLSDGLKTQPLWLAFERLWQNMVSCKMYITGGIGAIKQWEGFAQDYFLPQGTDEGGCFAETCAAIGVMMVANRALRIDLDAKYADILELCLYNAVLTAMSSDGQSFTYLNQLASSDKNLSKRENWFTISCCPPNLLRLLGHIAGYVWDIEPIATRPAVEVVVHLYISAETSLKLKRHGDFKIQQKTNWPLDGKIDFVVQSSLDVLIRLRIPSWSDSFELSPPCAHATVEKGYLTLPSTYVKDYPVFSLEVPMKPRWIAPSPRTGQVTVSLARGPLVYCVEDFDNRWVEDHFKSLYVDTKAAVHEAVVVEESTNDKYVSLMLRKGGHIVQYPSTTSSPSVALSTLDSTLHNATEAQDIHFIPYYYRGNRGGRGQMRVGLRRWCQL